MAGFGLSLMLFLCLKSHCLSANLGFLNPPLQHAANRQAGEITSFFKQLPIPMIVIIGLASMEADYFTPFFTIEHPIFQFFEQVVKFQDIHHPLEVVDVRPSP
jgi:hypothetical protein